MLWSGGEIFASLRASFFLLCLALSTFFTPPPTGEGLALPPLSVSRFSIAEEPGALPQEKTGTSYPRASLGMSRRLIPLTTGSHDSNRACLGFCWYRPLLSSQNRTQAHTEPSLVLSLFLPALLLWQGSKIPLQLVIHCLLDGPVLAKPYSLFSPPQIFALLTNC